ncbi:hypothetical protein ACHAWC_003450 [Mediolabrus comicus]
MTKIYAEPTNDNGRRYMVVELPGRNHAVELININPKWMKKIGRYLPDNVERDVTLPSHNPPVDRVIDLEGGSPDVHVGVVLFVRRQNKATSFYHPRSLPPSSTTIEELKRIVEGYDEVDGNDLVITLGPVITMYHPVLTSNDDMQKTLHDFQVADNDTITLHTFDSYSEVSTPAVENVQLYSQHDELAGRKYRITNLHRGGGTEGRAIQCFVAEQVEEGGDCLFGPANLLTMITMLISTIDENKSQFIEYYSGEIFTEDQLERQQLKGSKIGVRILKLLKTLHYNLDGESRHPPGNRTFTQRSFMYEQLGVCFDDDSSYGNRIWCAIETLQKIMRIKVGNKFFTIPNRAFPITSEPFGYYDAHMLLMEHFLDGSSVGKIDCNSKVTRANNIGGFVAPNWLPLSILGIEEPGWFDAVKITSNALCILVVEDGGLSNLLRKAKFIERFPCILVCNNGGSSSNDLRAFVSMLATTLKLPVFGFCDMNNGGIQGLLGYATSEEELFNTAIKWIGIRPSQLKSLKTSKSRHARSLLEVIEAGDGQSKAISDRSKSRIMNHIDGESKWLVSGGDRRTNREREMKRMLELGRGIDSQKAEDDQVIALIWRALVDVWSWQDDDDSNPNPGSEEPFMFAWS